MTTRNLNKTWVDVILSQYKQDFSDGVPFPVRYLLHHPRHQADLFYEIPKPIDPKTFQKSIIDFNIYTRQRESVDFEDENLKVWKRVKQPVPEEVQTAQEHVPTTDSTTIHPVTRRLHHVEEKLAARAATSGS